MKLRFIVIILFIVLSAKNSFAQLYEISLDEKVTKSTLIVEGKVVDQTSFWNPAHTMIYTSNTIEVYKIFKGTQTPSTIEVLTHGGNVGNDYIEASDLLALDKGYVGAFFCFPNSNNLKVPGAGHVLYDVYSSSQGFFKYDLSSNKAFAPFVAYNNIEGNFYKLLEQKTGTPIKVVNATYRMDAATSKNDATSQRIAATATITSFSPATVNAGALNNPATNVLTIVGSGFGTPVTGKQIVFKDGNNVNTTADYAVESTSPYVTLWTNNLITVRVPSRAATGKFGIVTAVADTGFSPTNLDVFYAVANATFSNTPSEPRLRNTNSQGGYTIVYSTSTAGSGTNITTDSAYDDFRRALRTWKELTGVNFIEGGNTTNQSVDANDNVNTIMLDNTNTGNALLPSGTLATTYSNYTLCTGAAYSQKTGFDMVIRKAGVSEAPDAFPFNKSYCSLTINTYDLEATLLHELGHALNLAHIYDPQEQTAGYTTRNPAKLMHPTGTLSIGRKALDESAYAGGLYEVMPQNNTNYGSCRFPSEMTPTTTTVSPYNECPASFPALPIAAGTTIPIDLYHATSNRNKDPQYNAIGTAGSTNGTGVTVTNNTYYAIKTNSSGNLNFSITNYTTDPVEAQINCSEQGARIALYQVNSCPTGQGYPAPGFVTTFNANTTRTINGLSANTSYLFYFDGLYGTKPTFNVTFTSGTTLPLIVSNFYGEANNAVNNLFIELQSASANMKLILERSSDGTTYQSLGPIALQERNTFAKYTYVDVSPFNDYNYYRVKMISPDGTFEYSKVVLLKNNLNGQVLMYPNPLIDDLTINLSYLLQDQYTIIITDVVGRRVYSQQSGATLVRIPFAKHANGSYFVQVVNSQKKVVAINKIVAGN